MSKRRIRQSFVPNVVNVWLGREMLGMKFKAMLVFGDLSQNMRSGRGLPTGIVWASNRYDTVTLTHLGLGRGLAVTALLIANAYATLANGGKTVAPHLVAKVVSTNGVASIHEAKAPPMRVFSDETSKTIASMLKEAMITAGKEFSVDLEGLDIAGMVSETRIPVNGEYSETDCNVAAAGFFPAESPKWVVVIGFGKPSPDHLAGRVALPVFVEIARKITSASCE